LSNWNYGKPWYHGSPFKLTILCRGSTITHDRELARVFSHKPTIISLSGKSLKHNGTIPGFLYQIAEDMKAGDIYPHPRSSMERGKEWLTTRELRVELVEPTQPANEEKLTEEEITELKKIIES